METFSKEHNRDPTEFAWYSQSRRADVRKVGIQDGDTLEVYKSLDSSSSNDDEQWLAQLAATEEKIIQLQNEVEFKRAELESAAIKNETIATM
ncbi:hypothetical protein E8E13_000023, partial [Curvularia kusanoi]